MVAGYKAWAQQPLPWTETTRLIEKFAPCNLGIVVPNGTVVVEGDSPEAEAEIEFIAAGATVVAPARERRPGRGRGWLFRVDSRLELALRTHRGATKAIDILPGGSIFVVPPSMHRTGHFYTWVAGRAPWEVPPVALPPGLMNLLVDPGHERAAAPKSISVTVPTSFTPGLSARVEFLLSSRPKLAALWNGEGMRRGDTSRSGYDYAVARELLSHGVPVQEVAEALAERPEVHRQDPTYLIRTALSAAGRSK